ncbi:MAG: hypothetical protein ACKO5K_11305 [Armatimonadota bacterium]
MRITLVTLGTVVCLLLRGSGSLADVGKWTRSDLASTAKFDVVYTLAPKGGSKETRTFRVEVSGNRARLDLEDPAMGSIRYVVDGKSAFLLMPASGTAQRMALRGGIDEALALAFAQVAAQMHGAKRVGSTISSGRPADIYKNERSGTTIHVGRATGFRLPVRMETANEGGKSTLLVTGIRLGGTLPAERFTLPKGTRILETSGPGNLPGIK